MLNVHPVKLYCAFVTLHYHITLNVILMSLPEEMDCSISSAAATIALSSLSSEEESENTHTENMGFQVNYDFQIKIKR